MHGVSICFHLFVSHDVSMCSTTLITDDPGSWIEHPDPDLWIRDPAKHAQHSHLERMCKLQIFVALIESQLVYGLPSGVLHNAELR